MLPLVGNGVRRPHCLGDHSASVYDRAVKKPRRSADNKELAFTVRERQSFNLWNGIALQQVEEVLLGSTAQESLGNVAIYEKSLKRRENVMSTEWIQVPSLTLVVNDTPSEVVKFPCGWG